MFLNGNDSGIQDDTRRIFNEIIVILNIKQTKLQSFKKNSCGYLIS